MIELIDLKGHKKHKGEGEQLSFKGIGLTPIEQEIALRVNELIREHNLEIIKKELDRARREKTNEEKIRDNNEWVSDGKEE